MQTQLLLLELNEVNFEFIEGYAVRGMLPNLAGLIDRHGYLRTTSEERYEELEPWIQWVTAHTGRSFAEHNVFRLGDIVARDIPQIWELLEQHGLRVGAVSPMNAKYRLRQPAFFVPDPWTRTQISGGRILRGLSRALAQAVSDNARARMTPSSAAALLAGVAAYARAEMYPTYARLALGSIGRPWRRAMFLDLLLSDVFIREVQRTRPQFASLFVNAAAHIQHHYMFSAAPYTGPHRNPDWYIKRGLDPVSEVYRLYDRLIGDVQRRFPAARLMIATGLHQVPHSEATFYWRLKDHAAFLDKIGARVAAVEPLMSRDFIVRCADRQQAQAVAERLRQARADDGIALFEVDQRSDDLFVMLTYPQEIRPGAGYSVGADRYTDLDRDVVFVALKNGEHDGIGYFIDTGLGKPNASGQFPLKDIPRRILSALGLPPSPIFEN